ncbi:hypothetical protein ONE63_011085 [Megalurothrips usitatus]|uniref:Reverse transcriptase Ty1/copia-type domain-containing protein n=1 Tax=Megalurothrips usitatus TaxID=439358 RepID=A0AAV7XIH0_9NEOP|nr:hypothetical protein ONE63_011085 [Megalurothrips usitatus]
MGDPISRSDALAGPDAAHWQQAMDSEFKSLIKNDIWTLVNKPADRQVIGSKWVFKLKKRADGSTRFKARLVAQGFSQKHGIDYEETFSPTIPHSTLKKCIYNNPEGFVVEGREPQVGKLKKAIYGLKQALRAWHVKANQILQELGFKKCPYEPCLFVKAVNGKLVIVGVYVDDLLLFADCIQAAESVITSLEQTISIRNLGEISEYLGIRVQRKDGAIMLDQSLYLERVLQRFQHQDCNPVSTPMEPGAKLSTPSVSQVHELPCREPIGSLMKGPIDVYCDNQGARLIASNDSSGSRFKHVEIQYHLTRTQVANKIIKIHHIGTREMPADILTKALPASRHNFCKHQLGIL